MAAMATRNCDKWQHQQTAVAAHVGLSLFFFAFPIRRRFQCCWYLFNTIYSFILWISFCDGSNVSVVIEFFEIFITVTLSWRAELWFFSHSLEQTPYIIIPSKVSSRFLELLYLQTVVVRSYTSGTYIIRVSV